eukprot:4179-Eustigmatos_ZCMA.PRE.1
MCAYRALFDMGMMPRIPVVDYGQSSRHVCYMGARVGPMYALMLHNVDVRLRVCVVILMSVLLSIGMHASRVH